MSDFKWRHFAGDIILPCVRWYCKYGISYRELEEMMEERGIDVDHTTLYRWVQTYAPQIEKRLRWYRKGGDFDRSWRVDETYVKVKGEWKYLYRAVNAQGRTIEFYLSSTRTISAATIFLKKALRAAKDWNQPHTITTRLRRSTRRERGSRRYDTAWPNTSTTSSKRITASSSVLTSPRSALSR